MSIDEADMFKDYEDLVNRKILQQFGKEIERVANRYSVIMKQDEESYTF